MANAQCSQANPATLAWMVSGANPAVSIRFNWSTDYNFAWFDQGLPASQQVVPASLNSANTVTLGQNAYGYTFNTPTYTSELSGCLVVKSDGTVPATNSIVAGVGMHGAGTFGVGASPNTQCLYTPVQDADLVYWISFGRYTFDVNAVLPLATLNPPGKISFPAGVYTMTAELNSTNIWSVYQGAPAPSEMTSQVLVYEAGQGTVSA